jgi:drug/metabolite transporter (DMT)-like permease
LAVAFLLPFAARSSRTDWNRLSGRARLLTISAGLLLGLHFIVWIEAIYHTGVASASVLFTTNPLFIAGFGYIVLRERLLPSTVVAILVSVSGAALIGLGDATDEHFPRAMLGNGLALSAAILFAAYLLIGRVARQTSSWLAYVFPLYVTSALAALAYGVIRGVPLFGFGWEVFAACALMALGPQILGHGSLNYAVKFFPAALIGLLGLVEPVLATVWAYLLFDEIPSSVTMTGIAVTLFALGMVYWPSRKSSRGRSE